MKRVGPLLIIAVSLLFAGLQMWRGFHDVIDTDYIGFATAARTLESGLHCVYCETVQHQTEESYLGVGLPAGVQSAFANPAPALLLVAPLALLSPVLGFTIFVVIALGASAIAVWLLASRFASPTISVEWRLAIAALAVWSLPATWGLALGQWDPLLLLAAVSGLTLLSKEKKFAAGLLLALVFCKPQLGWMLVPLFVAVAEWRLVAGLLVGAIAWLLGTVVMVGAGSIGDLMRIILGQHYQEAPRTIGVAGLVGAVFHSSLVVFVVAVLGMAVCALVVWRRREIWRRDPIALGALGLALSVVLSPHVWPEDLIMLAPLLVIWTRVGYTKVLITAIALSGAYMLDLKLPVGWAHVETLVQAWMVYAFWLDSTRPGRKIDQSNIPVAETIQTDSA